MSTQQGLEGASVLVTGSSGFLGSVLVREILMHGAKVVGIDRTASPIQSSGIEFVHGACENVLAPVVERTRPDVIFHLAGPASVGASMQHPMADFDGLIPGVAALGDVLLREHLHPQIILFSSAAVYGEPTQLPIDETAPVAPISPYGIHKATAESLLGHYGRIGSFPIAALRIFSAYGQGLRRQLFWDLGLRALRAKRDGVLTVEIFGTGAESRDFVHVHDVVEAACVVAMAPLQNGLTALNLASGKETLISHAADRLVKAIDPRLTPRFSKTKRQGDPSRWVANIDRLKAVGFQPKRAFETEIVRLAHWIEHDFTLQKDNND